VIKEIQNNIKEKKFLEDFVEETEAHLFLSVIILVSGIINP
jgi:hypothetical protein